MEFSDLVGVAWTNSVPVEPLLDLAGIVAGALAAVWLLRFVVRRKRVLCVVGGTCYSAWFGWKVFVEGGDVLYETHRRWLRCYDVTERFVLDAVELMKAWGDFFLPFLSDVSRSAARSYGSLSAAQRLAITCGCIFLCSVIEAFRFVRRHTQTITFVLFHASFLLGGPLLWYTAGQLPADWLRSTRCLSISLLPAIASAITLSQPPEEPLATPRMAHAKGARGKRLAAHRLWLSYWSCWPLLALLEGVLDLLPGLCKTESGAEQLQIESSRIMLVLVVWLQFWQGSKLLQFFLESLVKSTPLLGLVAAIGNRGDSLLRAGAQLTGSSAGRLVASGGSSWRVLRLVRNLGSRIWTIAAMSALCGIALCLLTWLFYRAVRVLSAVLTVAVWCFAAVDTADTLSKNAEMFYPKKLSFWVLAMLWDCVASLPYVGAVLRLFTPVAFSLWLVAGEVVFNRIVLPIVKMVTASVRSARDSFCGLCRRQTAAEEEEDDEDEEAEEEAADIPVGPASEVVGEVAGSAGSVRADTSCAAAAGTGGTDGSDEDPPSEPPAPPSEPPGPAGPSEPASPHREEVMEDNSAEIEEEQPLTARVAELIRRFDTNPPSEATATTKCEMRKRRKGRHSL